MRRTLTVGLCGVALAMAVTGCNRHKPDGTEACTAGVPYVIACDDEGVGRCSGDPVLRVCDGSSSPETCASGGVAFLDEDDDSGGGVCPRAMAVCPPSGAFSVTTRAFGSGRFSCDWRVEVEGTTEPLVEADGGS